MILFKQILFVHIFYTNSCVLGIAILINLIMEITTFSLLLPYKKTAPLGLIDTYSRAKTIGLSTKITE